MSIVQATGQGMAIRRSSKFRESQSGGGGSYSLVDSVTGTTNGSTTQGGSSASRGLAGRFTASKSYTVTKVVIPLFKTGSPSWNLSVSIYSHDSGNDRPLSIVGTGSSTISTTTLTGSITDYEFLVNASITSGDTFWVFMLGDGYQDASNVVNWDRYSVSLTNAYWVWTGATWSAGSNTRRMKLATYETV